MRAIRTKLAVFSRRSIAIVVLGVVASRATAQVIFRASVSAQGQPFVASSLGRLSADGRYIALTAPSTAFTEIPAPFVPGFQVVRREISTGVVDIVSRSESGQIVPQQIYTAAEAISADGSVVAFSSETPDLVSGDTNQSSDVFVRDFTLGTLERVSTGPNGEQGDAGSFSASLSSDGRFVAFISGSWTFTGPNPSPANVFVKDRQLGTIRLASVNSAGVPANVGTPPFCAGWYCDAPQQASISGDGRFVVFDSVATNLSPLDINGWFPDIYVHDLQTGVTELASVSQFGTSSSWGMSRYSSISDDGRFIVFTNDGDDMVSGLPAGQALTRVYRRDRLAQITELVDVDPVGAPAPWGSASAAVSGDGRYVVFSSAGSLAPPFGNVQPDLFVRDMLLGVTRRVGSPGATSMSFYDAAYPHFTADNSAIAFFSNYDALVAGDTNGVGDVFIVDLRHNAPVPQTYCSATTNSLGCAPSITSSGVPSPATNYTFSVSATGARNQRTGALLWSFTTGQTPFFGGTLCLGSPLRFLPARSTQGRALGTNDCSGWRSEWFTPAAMAAHGWTIGANVHAQFAFRDPGLPAGSLSLSNALQFQILP